MKRGRGEEAITVASREISRGVAKFLSTKRVGLSRSNRRKLG